MPKNSLLIFTFCLFTFSFAVAQWSTSPDSALQIGFGEHTEIISDGKGGAFVLFHGFENVRVQKLDKYGYIQWTNITPQGGLDVGGSTSDSCWQTTNIQHSATVADGEGGVYVMFDDVCCIANCQGAPQTITQALIQHFDSLGNWLWGSGLPVSIRNSYETWTGAIVTDGVGGIIALYNEKDSVNAPSKLYAQRFDGADSRLWGNEGIVVKEPGGFTAAASDGEGGLIFTWSFSIQRIDSQGQKMYGENGIAFATGGVRIEVDHENGYVYAQGGNYIGGSQNRIAVQKLALSDGSLQWDSLGVTIDTLGVQERVKGFDFIPNNGVAITWNEEVSSGNWDVFVQWLTPDGNFLYDIGGIPASTFSSSKNAWGLLTSTKGDTSVIIYWGDSRGGLYAQRLNHLGARLWGQGDIAITSFATIDSDITSDSNGGLIFSLAKFYDFIISAQQISVNGNLGEILTSINKDKPKFISRQFQLFQNYPNPFNPSTVIEFQLTSTTEVELTIYNLLGQEITKLISEKLLPGKHTVEWDGSEDSGIKVTSGVYYYRLKANDQTKTRKMLLIR
jgi:FlgD Ig-like domain